MNNYNGDVRYKEKFTELIKNNNSTHQIRQNPLIEHEIDFENENCDSNKLYNKPYRTTRQEKTLIDKNIKELQENGYIRDSKSQFTSPVVIIKKRRNRKILH
ncbi:hypothetical protein COBT_001421 [Conglomerata obtusa]